MDMERIAQAVERSAMANITVSSGAQNKLVAFCMNAMEEEYGLSVDIDKMTILETAGHISLYVEWSDAHGDDISGDRLIILSPLKVRKIRVLNR